MGLLRKENLEFALIIPDDPIGPEDDRRMRDWQAAKRYGEEIAKRFDVQVDVYVKGRSRRYGSVPPPAEGTGSWYYHKKPEE